MRFLLTTFLLFNYIFLFGCKTVNEEPNNVSSPLLNTINETQEEIEEQDKPQTIIVPTGSLGEISEARIKILEKTLESKLDDHFSIIPKDLFEEAQEKAFEELNYDECTEEQCIMMIKEILQVENAFQLVLISEGQDTQISLTWNDLDKKRVEVDYCEGCKTKQLIDSISGLVAKMFGQLGFKKIEPVQQIQTVEVQSSKVEVRFYKSENGILKWEKYGDEKIHDKYVGQIRNNLPHGPGTLTWTDGSILEGQWEDGKMNGKGTITWSDGEIWKGDFYKDKRWNVIEYNSSGEVIGKWSNGKKQQ